MQPTDPIEQYLQDVTHAQRGLYAYILSLVHDLAAADDILQETNLVLWRKRDQFEAGTNFRAWATRIAHFQVMAWRKTHAKEKLRFDDTLVDQLAGESAQRAERIDPRRRALAECLEKLPAKDRDLIRHRYASGQPVGELASRVGRTANAVYQALHRVRGALLNCIERATGLEAEA